RELIGMTRRPVREVGDGIPEGFVKGEGIGKASGGIDYGRDGSHGGGGSGDRLYDLDGYVFGDRFAAAKTRNFHGLGTGGKGKGPSNDVKGTTMSRQGPVLFDSHWTSNWGGKMVRGLSTILTTKQ